MSGLTLYALKGVPQVSLLAAVFLTLSLFFPPLAWLSSALIALVTLRKGWQHGVIVLGVSSLGAAAFFSVSFDGGWSALILASLFWLPVFFMALSLRFTVKLDISLLLAAIIGFIGLSMVYVIQNDPSATWLDLLRETIQPDIWAQHFDVPPKEFDGFLQDMSKLMPGSTSACLVFSAVVSLLLARRWQARLFNPGGFQLEYHKLRYGRYAAIVALLITVLGLSVQSSYALGLVAIVVATYLFQGVALVHALVKLKSLNTSWLVVMYGLCAVLPQLIVVLGGIGLFDTWWDLRKRVTAT